MPEFLWKAVTKTGQVEEGQTSAPSNLHVLRQLRSQGLTPVSVDETSSAGDSPGNRKTLRNGASPVKAALAVSGTARKAGGAINQADLLALTSELAIMLRAGLALDNALRVLIDMSHKTSVVTLLTGILDAVKGGTPLSRALMAERALFGDFYINMVRSGEASGQMSAVLTRLVEHMERLRALRESVISATIYPAILLAVAVLSLVAMLGFVVPQFEKLFTDMGDALPMPTRIVMSLGHVFTQYGVLLAMGAAAMVWAGRQWLRSDAGKNWWQRIVLNMPIIGRLTVRYELTLFSRSLGTLLGNGVPMLSALHIATETVGNKLLRDPLAAMAPYVKEGGRVVDAMSMSGIFEPLAINLVRVGEETGRIGPMMLELAHILNREVETGIKRALTLVEPILILVLGVLIASIIVSILLGILSVNDLAV